MKLNLSILCLAMLLCVSLPVIAQNQYSIPACKPDSKSKLGERLKLSLPKGAIVKKGRDVDYEEYNIRFGKKKDAAWLSGIYGPSATSGAVPQDWLSSSSEVSQRTWKFEKYEGVDAKGKLANGNYWRYFGKYGESMKYYDVPADAAAYFDKIIDSVCFLEWQ